MITEREPPPAEMGRTRWYYKGKGLWYDKRGHIGYWTVEGGRRIWIVRSLTQIPQGGIRGTEDRDGAGRP